MKFLLIKSTAWNENKNRPIVAKFVNFKDREKVRKTSLTALRDQSDRKYNVFEQYPKEINDQRKLLYPHYKAAKRQGKRAQLVMDKLYIEGKELFVFTEEHQENPNYVPQKGISVSPLCRVNSTHSTDVGQWAKGRTTTEVLHPVNLQM